MSLIIGNGMCITYFETEIHCPICDQKFDGSKKMDGAKYPIFNMRCLVCKGKITVKIPIFGGELECWETECPSLVRKLKTKTPNRVNGKIIKKDDDSDDDDFEEEDFDMTEPPDPNPVLQFSQ